MHNLLDRWRLLAEWADPARAPRPAARDLLGGVQPENPANRRELLILALLAVSTNRSRLREEFAARSFLGPGTSLDALVNRQYHLTEEVIGTANPLKTLGVLVSEALPAPDRLSVRRSQPPMWTPNDEWRADADVIWQAAVRFGHLAQTIAQALALNDTVIFYRYLSSGAQSSNRFLINDIACVNEPWAAGTRRIQSYAESGMRVFEWAVPPASIVAVTHIEPSRAHEEHPTRFAGESGHPVITASPPLALHTSHHYPGPHRLSRWRQIPPAHICNH
jgi:hypothetical protein